MNKILFFKFFANTEHIKKGGGGTINWTWVLKLVHFVTILECFVTILECFVTILECFVTILECFVTILECFGSHSISFI